MRSLLPLLLCCSLNLQASDNWQLFRSGSAYDLETNALLYIENHFMQCANPAEVQVKYSHNGELFAQKSLHFYPNNFVPDLLYEDLRLHKAIRVTQNGSYIDLQTDTEKARLPRLENTVADAGFDKFIAARLLPLDRGESQVLDFVSPTRLDTYAFEVRTLHSTEQQLEILLQPKAKWLQWLLDPIYVTYQRTPFRINRYAGISNVEDAKEHYQHVRIDYHYYAVCGLSGS